MVTGRLVGVKGVGMRGEAARVAREAMRLRLVDAAGRVLAERGIGGVTTRAVAEAAGVAEGSIYNHFPGKKDLVAAALVHRLPDLGADLAAASAAPDPLDGLRRLGTTAVVFYEQLLPVIAQVAPDPELVRRVQADLARLHRGPLRFHEEVARLLDAAQAAGRLRLPGPAPMVAALFLGACREWAGVQRFGLPPGWPDDPEEFVGSALATLLGE